MKRCFVLSVALFSFLFVSPVCANDGDESEDREQVDDFDVTPPTHVAFSARIGRTQANIPASPGNGTKVSQKLYAVSLGLSFPLFDSVAGLFSFGGFDALYPVSGQRFEGGLSSLVRGKIGVSYATGLFDYFQTTGTLGYEMIRMHYGSAVVGISSPRFGLEVAGWLPAAAIYEMVPGVAISGAYFGAFGSYTSNIDKTPVLVNSAGKATSIDAFSSNGEYSGWEVSVSPELAFQSEGTSGQVSFFWILREESLRDLKKKTGIGKKTQSGNPIYSVLGLGLERSL